MLEAFFDDQACNHPLVVMGISILDMTGGSAALRGLAGALLPAETEDGGDEFASAAYAEGVEHGG